MGQAAKALPPVYAGDAPDYSLVDCWVQVPEITKDVDTFYIFSTSYVEGSTADEARLFMGEGVDLTLEEQKVFAQRAVGDAVPYLKEEDKKYYEEFRRVCRFQEPGLVETEFIDEIMFRVPMLQQLDAQSAFNKTF